MALLVLAVLGIFTIRACLQPGESALNRGRLLLALHQPIPAGRAFQRYLAIEGDSVGSLAEVGDAYLEARHWSEAARCFEPVVRKEPRHGARLFLALCYEKLHRDREAEQLYREGVALNPSDPYSLNGLGYFYAQRGIRLQEALLLLHRALDLDPQAGGILDSLGWALYQRDDVAAALPQLTAASERIPSSGEIRYHLGMALARSGLRDRALVELGKAVILEPDLTGAREALALVRAGRRPPVPAPLERVGEHDHRSAKGNQRE
ncbi:MAG TPA: tetratricopeptide repeat protein [Armatimonadota bacterium]|nr:tetratricopeptide repeat protein [Armatimonadota bacterium]